MNGLNGVTLMGPIVARFQISRDLIVVEYWEVRTKKKLINNFMQSIVENLIQDETFSQQLFINYFFY